jgi:MFS family permease
MNRILPFLAAYLGMLIFGICMLTLGSVMPYLDQALHLHELAKGSLASILPIGILAGSLVFGPIVDRYSYRILLFLSAAVAASGILLIGYASRISALQIAFFFIGLGGGSLNGTTSALISDLSTEGSRQKGANLSLLGVFFGIGALGIPAIFGLISDLQGHRNALLWIGAGIMFIAFGFLLIRYPGAKRRSFNGWGTWKLLLGKRLIIFIGLVLFIQSGMESLVNNWITSFFTLHSGMQTQVSLHLLTLFVMVFTLTRLLLKFILLKTSLGWVMGAAAFLILAGGLFLKNMQGMPGTYAAVICLGTGLAAGFPVLLGVVGDTFPERSGTAFSIVFTISVIGNSMINYMVGWITELKGMGGLPWILIVVSVAYIMLLYNLLRNINSTKK